MIRVFLFFIVFVGLCTLGVWQLQRQSYKNQLQKNINSNDFSICNNADDLPQNLNKNVEIQGTLDYRKIIYLYNLRDNIPGYLVIAPLIIDNKALAVDLGWVKHKPKITQKTAKVKIFGYLTNVYHLPRWMVNSPNHEDKDVWHRLDQERLQSLYDKQTFNFLLVAVNHLQGKRHITLSIATLEEYINV